jgi:lysophospholipase L1-like esterase
MSSTLGRCAKKAGIVAALTVLLVLLLELGLRMAGYADFAAVYYDPKIGLRYYPNQRRHMLTGEHDLGTMSINQWGFRSPPFGREKRARSCRVVCLGDSFTLGWGADDAHTYPHVLQEWCDRELGPGRIEVLDCGLPDFNTVNEERLYRAVVHDFSPDVVVLGYVLNDLAPETLGPINMNSRLEYLVGSTAIMRFLRLHLWHRLGIYKYGNNSENHRRRMEFEANEPEVLLHPDGVLGKPYWDVSLSALAQLAAEVKRDGAKFLLMSFPTRKQIEALPQGGEDVRTPQRRLAKAAGDLGIPFLDLVDAFAGHGLASFSDLDRAHPSPDGYALTAETLGSRLRELGWLGAGTR